MHNKIVNDHLSLRLCTTDLSLELLLKWKTHIRVNDLMLVKIHTGSLIKYNTQTV